MRQARKAATGAGSPSISSSAQPQPAALQGHARELGQELRDRAPRRDRRALGVAQVVQAQKARQVARRARPGRRSRWTSNSMPVAVERLLEPAGDPLAELLRAGRQVAVPVEPRGRDVEQVGRALLDHASASAATPPPSSPASRRPRRPGAGSHPGRALGRLDRRASRPPPPRPRSSGAATAEVVAERGAGEAQRPRRPGPVGRHRHHPGQRAVLATAPRRPQAARAGAGARARPGPIPGSGTRCPRRSPARATRPRSARSLRSR